MLHGSAENDSNYVHKWDSDTLALKRKTWLEGVGSGFFFSRKCYNFPCVPEAALFLTQFWRIPTSSSPHRNFFLLILLLSVLLFFISFPSCVTFTFSPHFPPHPPIHANPLLTPAPLPSRGGGGGLQGVCVCMCISCWQPGQTLLWVASATLRWFKQTDLRANP